MNNRKLSQWLSFTILITLLLSGCGPGQMFGATITPSPTNTPIPPTATLTPIPPTATATNTPLPPTVTNTPAPPTATLEPTNTPDPSIPSYSDVLKTYPDNVELSCTDVEVSGFTSNGEWIFTGGKFCNGVSEVTISPGGKITTTEKYFSIPLKSYGAKITIMEATRIDGHTYQPGDKLTVSKNRNWILVSSWD